MIKWNHDRKPVLYRRFNVCQVSKYLQRFRKGCGQVPDLRKIHQYNSHEWWPGKPPQDNSCTNRIDIEVPGVVLVIMKITFSRSRFYVPANIRNSDLWCWCQVVKIVPIIDVQSKFKNSVQYFFYDFHKITILKTASDFVKTVFLIEASIYYIDSCCINYVFA